MPLFWGRAVVYGLLTEAILIVMFIASLALGLPAIYMTMYLIGRVVQPNAAPQSVAYWIAHALKFTGGAVGGGLAYRRRSREQTRPRDRPATN